MVLPNLFEIKLIIRVKLNNSNLRWLHFYQENLILTQQILTSCIIKYLIMSGNDNDATGQFKYVNHLNKFIEAFSS